MIPKQMDQFLHEVLPESSWRNRLDARGPLRFVEFRSTDLERLHRLGIGVDRLGPRLVVCMWDEESRIEAGGYLVVDNLAMGRPAMGGIRMLPDITPLTVFNLARGMTLKNAAAGLPFGGGKTGIVAPAAQPSIPRSSAASPACFTATATPTCPARTWAPTTPT